MTCVMSTRSRPRAATSVATSVLTFPGAKTLERSLARRLRHVAVQRDGRHVVTGQALGEPVGAALRPDKDERETALGFELLDQTLDLVLGRHRLETMLDVGLDSCRECPRTRSATDSS